MGKRVRVLELKRVQYLSPLATALNLTQRNVMMDHIVAAPPVPFVRHVSNRSPHESTDVHGKSLAIQPADGNVMITSDQDLVHLGSSLSPMQQTISDKFYLSSSHTTSSTIPP